MIAARSVIIGLPVIARVAGKTVSNRGTVLIAGRGCRYSGSRKLLLDRDLRDEESVTDEAKSNR